MITVYTVCMQLCGFGVTCLSVLRRCYSAGSSRCIRPDSDGDNSADEVSGDNHETAFNCDAGGWTHANLFFVLSRGISSDAACNVVLYCKK